ncbi:3'-5' exonuclease [Shewanella sp. NIFS-20-20]|uniref:3'-5' exonuclease n=1 Tax=Shewanella sp. NIFS-20-20 TaxID=2853806 RepID=UPI001C48E264|nr:3'-5' exonuclease [Shewanella sp. NIFS-20-20]MBV7316350.1 3'-5' exonuclease [Shewanella sp. NIFS-20-20]
MTSTINAWSQYYQARHQRAQNPVIKAFFGHGCVAPLTPLSEVEFVAMDFETTGLDPAIDDIISIGIVPFSLGTIPLSTSQHWLLKPQAVLDEGSVIIHGITHSHIDNAPDLQEVYSQLLKAIRGKIVVVHYRPIEREFLDNALKTRLGEGVRFPLIDTMEIEHRVHGRSKPWWQFWPVSTPSLRLIDSRERYHLPRYQQHHALTDALATAELFQAQIAWHYQTTTPLNTLWC